jgi:hypothetical protein
MRKLLSLLVCLFLPTIQSVCLSADAIIDVEAGTVPAATVVQLENHGSLGGTMTPGKKGPTIAMVEGRSALVFDGTESLTSSFSLSELSSFSVEAWAANASIERLETMLFFAPSKGGPGTEFNYSNSSNGGAFRSGFKSTAAFDPVPAAGAWHHIVWSYSGSNRTLAVYVDGELNSSRAFALTVPAQAHFMLGCAGENNLIRQPFGGALSRVRVFKTALTQDDVRRSGNWINAFSPSPKNGSTSESLSVALKWECGSTETAAYTVFLGTDREAVKQGDPRAFKGQMNVPSAGPFSLVLGAVHFWRIQELDKAGNEVSPGVIWSFKAEEGLADSPEPREQNSNVKVTTQNLVWKPGKYASNQHLYFGTDRNDVEHDKSSKTDLGATAGNVQIPGEKLLAGTRYFWKINNENGTQPPSQGNVWTFRTQDEHVKNDVTFFVSSDTHYGRENNGEINRATIDSMNALPGTAIPQNMGGGIVHTPRGVVLNGDLLDEGFDQKTAPGFWKEFCRDYGLTGDDGRLCVPMYEGFGNHDGGPTKSISRAGIKERNPKRVGLTAISDNGLHYSWDWDHVHLVQLNLFGGVGPEDVHGVNQAEHDPQDAYGFLKQDLEKNVGASARLVIVFQHFGVLGGMADWWTPIAKSRLYDLLKGYNLACLINGHSHGASIVPWNEFLTIHDGATARPDSGTGDFLVVRVTEKELTVVQRKRDGWGMFTKRPLKYEAHP